jgi:extracellular matrix protein 14
MRRPTFAVLSLLFLGPTAAAPHDTTAPSPFDAGTYATTHNASPRPWRRLSDAIIRTIWNLPHDQKSSGCKNAQGAGNAIGDKLVAQYSEDVVLRFKIRTVEEASALAEAADTLFLDVWEFNDDWADIRLSKDVVPSLLGLLPSSLQKSHEPLLQDLNLAQAIFNTYPSQLSTQQDDHFSPILRPSSRTGKGHPFFQEYQPLSVIDPWMRLMSSMFTTHVRRINVGITYEGRDIPALRVGVHPTNDEQPSKPRKTIMITGGLHAREWISTSTVNYLAWSFINAYGKDREMTRLLEDFDFVFVPTLNPDGYVYSWETDRLWRKNRQPTNLRFCRGVDLGKYSRYNVTTLLLTHSRYVKPRSYSG